MSAFLRKKWMLTVLLNRQFATSIGPLKSSVDSRVAPDQDVLDYRGARITKRHDGSLVMSFPLDDIRPSGQILQFLSIPGVMLATHQEGIMSQLAMSCLGAENRRQRSWQNDHSKENDAYLFFSDKWHYTEAVFTAACLQDLSQQRYGRSLSSLEGAIVAILKGHFLLEISNQAWLSPTMETVRLKKHDLQCVMVVDRVNWIGGDGNPPHGEPEDILDSNDFLCSLEGHREVIWNALLPRAATASPLSSAGLVSRQNSVKDLPTMTESEQSMRRTTHVRSRMNGKLLKIVHIWVNASSTMKTISKEEDCTIFLIPSSNVAGNKAETKVYTKLGTSEGQGAFVDGDNLPLYFLGSGLARPHPSVIAGPVSLKSRPEIQSTNHLAMSPDDFHNADETFPELDMFCERKKTELKSNEDPLHQLTFEIDDDDCYLDEAQEAVLQNLPGWNVAGLSPIRNSE